MANMLERAVPRYTSYPTAPNFNAAVDAEVYRTWLAGLPGEAALSLYLHVPFCRELCHYCGCHTKATLRDEPIEAYAQRLVEEIAIVAGHAAQRLRTLPVPDQIRVALVLEDGHAVGRGKLE